MLAVVVAVGAHLCPSRNTDPISSLSGPSVLRARVAANASASCISPSMRFRARGARRPLPIPVTRQATSSSSRLRTPPTPYRVGWAVRSSLASRSPRSRPIPFWRPANGKRSVPVPVPLRRSCRWTCPFGRNYLRGAGARSADWGRAPGRPSGIVALCEAQGAEPEPAPRPAPRSAGCAPPRGAASGSARVGAVRFSWCVGPQRSRCGGSSTSAA